MRPLKPIILTLGLFLSLGSVITDTVLAVQITDVTGKIVQVSDRPKRIVTLAPSLAEIVGELLDHSAERVVGVSEYTQEPSQYKNLPKIGPYHRVNFESVKALDPDLVLAWKDGNFKDQVDHLRELGLPVVVVSTERLSIFPEAIELIGKAIGEGPKATELAGRFRKQVELLREQVKKGPPIVGKRIVLQVGIDPLVVAAGHSFVTDGFELLGFENVYREQKSAYPRPAIEDVIQKKPDWIVILAVGMNPVQLARESKHWEQLAGAKKSFIPVILDDPALTRSSPQILDALQLASRKIQKLAKNSPVLTPTRSNVPAVAMPAEVNPPANGGRP